MTSALQRMANYDWSSFDNNIAKANELATKTGNTIDNTLLPSEYSNNYLNNLNNPFVFNNTNTVPVQANTGNVVPQTAQDWTSVYGDPSRVQGFDNRGQPLGGGIEPIYNNALGASNNAMSFAPIKTAKSFIQNKILNKANIPSFVPMTAAMLGAMLPKEDPMITDAKNYYAGMYGTDDIGRIAEGDLMAGYNPVSGGGLYTLTGGKLGEPPNVGLDRAYQKRIEGIEKTLKNLPKKFSNLRKTNRPAYDKKVATLNDRIVQLKQRQDNDNIKMQNLRLKHATKGQKQTIQDYRSGKMNKHILPDDSGGGAPVSTARGNRIGKAASASWEAAEGI